MATPAPLPTPGPSDVWGEDLNEAVDQRYNLSLHDVEVGPGLWVDRSDPTKPKIYRTELAPVSDYRFRGEWNLKDSLVYTQDFSSGTTVPSEFTITDAGGSLARVSSPTISSTVPSTYTFALRATETDTYSTNAGVNINFGSISALSGLYVTKVMLWLAGQSTDATPFTTVRDSGTELTSFRSASGTTNPWREITVPMTAFSTAINPTKINTQDSYNQNGYFWVTGIRIWAAKISDSYVLNDTVTYGGALYRCLYTGTTETPGVGAHWEAIPFSFAPGGPYQTYIDTRVMAIGSRVDDPADVLWGGSNAYDLEFTTDDTSGTLPSGWSWVNQGTSTYVQKFGKAVLHATPPTSGSYAWRILNRAFPTEATWTATMKFNVPDVVSNYFHAGLLLRDSTTGKFVSFMAYGSPPTFYVMNWTNETTWSSTTTGAFNVPDIPSYMRIKKNSPTSYDFSYSKDGISWAPIVTAYDPTAFLTTIDSFGIGLDSTLVERDMSIDWFRVR